MKVHLALYILTMLVCITAIIYNNVKRRNFYFENTFTYILVIVFYNLIYWREEFATGVIKFVKLLAEFLNRTI